MVCSCTTLSYSITPQSSPLFSVCAHCFVLSFYYFVLLWQYNVIISGSTFVYFVLLFVDSVLPSVSLIILTKLRLVQFIQFPAVTFSPISLPGLIIHTNPSWFVICTKQHANCNYFCYFGVEISIKRSLLILLHRPTTPYPPYPPHHPTTLSTGCYQVIKLQEEAC
jgi:hypothetical protein